MTIMDDMWWLWRGLIFVLGLAIVWGTLVSAIKTFILPRGINVWLTAFVFRVIGLFFVRRARKVSDYQQRDRIMALFVPMTLFILPLVFLTLVQIGYMFLYWAEGQVTLWEAFRLSGSSLLTLGYEAQDSFFFKVLEFSEAMLGLILVALLIAYLPSMYSAFTKRETAVALLESWAGTPPSAEEMIARVHRNGELEHLHEFWTTWQAWFAEIEESHTSLSPLAFFRSPQPERHWVTAAGTVLDVASLLLAAVDVPWQPRAAFCIRSGYLSLRQIAGFFNISYNPEPTANDPISIGREEFDAVCERLAAEGVALKPDRDQSWQDFVGWRVNYDHVLLALAALTMAPYAPWSSDRSPLQFTNSNVKPMNPITRFFYARRK